MIVCVAHNLSDKGFLVLDCSKELPNIEVGYHKILLTHFHRHFRILLLYPKILSESGRYHLTIDVFDAVHLSNAMYSR